MPRTHELVLGLLLAALVLAPGPAAAQRRGAAPDPKDVPRIVLLRVQVDAAGKVQSARDLDAKEVPALARAAIDIANKLQFAPARKDGKPVASETSLLLTLSLVPKADGNLGIALRRAQNGPSVVQVGKALPGRVSHDNGGTVTVAADVRADGSVDMASFKVEKIELRTPSSKDEARFTEAARHSLKDTRFMLDKVDGVDSPARITVPYQFNGGPAKRELEDTETEPTFEAAPPSIIAVSTVQGVELPKIDYQAPSN